MTGMSNLRKARWASYVATSRIDAQLQYYQLKEAPNELSSTARKWHRDSEVDKLSFEERRSLGLKWTARVMDAPPVIL